MTTVYKLTTQGGMTYGHTFWKEGVTHTAKGTGGLCSSGVIHSYPSPLIAVLMNPIHANINNPKLWKADCPAVTHNDGTKLGSKSLTILECIELPVINTKQKVIFAILCAEAALNLVDMPQEAEKHLQVWRKFVAEVRQNGWRMKSEAARAAATAVARAAPRAARAAAGAAWAARAAKAAAYAAAEAAEAVWAAKAAEAAKVAEAAAWAVEVVARAAARAAWTAEAAADKIDLVRIAEEAFKLGAE